MRLACDAAPLRYDAAGEASPTAEEPFPTAGVSWAVRCRLFAGLPFPLPDNQASGIEGHGAGTMAGGRPATYPLQKDLSYPLFQGQVFFHLKVFSC